MHFKSKIIDQIGSRLVPMVAPFLKRARFDMRNSPLTSAALASAGVFPILDHFHEPMIDTSRLKNLDAARILPAINFNVEAQISFLSNLSEDGSVNVLFEQSSDAQSFALKNGYFENGDADLWFRVIQHFRPSQIIEIGSGHSTKVAHLALMNNQRDDAKYHCDHVCIDPYAPQFLEQLGAKIIRQKVETLNLNIFSALKSGDILFIDSSHVIRPQGDVLFEYLEILPMLASGVIVHIHDIFTPRDYLSDWLQNRRYFWNEQYLVEAFLSNNNVWEVLLAANMMMHDNFDLFQKKCPSLDRENPVRSLYIRRL